ncbi:MAG: hypothetical protein CSA76_04465 [Spirochaetales bacterium]|nr:MAG: hypothetical protein CSA76_04465 [Spirochaetales bacterium]
MEVDENDIFDESIDPYDRSLDCEDDGIPDSSDLTEEELEDSDDNWDEDWNDENDPLVIPPADSEDDDYDALET